MAKRRAAEDALRIIAEKEAAVAAAAVAKQASELQEAIDMPAQKGLAINKTAAHKGKVVDDTDQEDMAVDSAAATPAKASCKGKMLATPDTPIQMSS